MLSLLLEIFISVNVFQFIDNLKQIMHKPEILNIKAQDLIYFSKLKNN